jgi:hypothetical protein
MRVLTTTIFVAELITMSFLGCAPPPDPPGPTFSLLVEDTPGGALLSAWSDGDDALIVGGNAGGGSGVLVRYRAGRLCVDDTVSERALWWIHGPRASEWYAVGERGTIVHDTDGTRVREDVDTDATLYGVWAGDDGVVWAVGGDFTTEPTSGWVWRRQDDAWSLFAGPLDGALFKVWDGWFVGEAQAYRLEGDELVAQDVGDERFLTVRGRAEDDVWIVGGWGPPAVQRYTAAGWEVVDTSALSQPLNGVWTAPGEPVWVAGMSGLTAFLDDDGWTRPEVAPSLQHFHAVWRHGDDVLFVGGNMLDTGDQQGTIVRYAIDDAPAQLVDCSSW